MILLKKKNPARRNLQLSVVNVVIDNSVRFGSPKLSQGFCLSIRSHTSGRKGPFGHVLHSTLELLTTLIKQSNFQDAITAKESHCTAWDETSFPRNSVVHFALFSLCSPAIKMGSSFFINEDICNHWCRLGFPLRPRGGIGSWVFIPHLQTEMRWDDAYVFPFINLNESCSKLLSTLVCILYDSVINALQCLANACITQ